MSQVIVRFGGAEVRRVVDRSGARIPEHAHDRPLLSLFVLGAYRNTTEAGTLDIGGPSAILYAAGARHANVVGADGFEQIEIEFEPDWAGLPADLATRGARWVGGPVAAAARELALSCATPPTEAGLRRALTGLLDLGRGETTPPAPAWLAEADRLARASPDLTAAGLARHVARHASWLGVRHRRHAGEPIRRTLARIRTERAARLLRETDDPPALIAAEAGFCDQSHMIRVFRRLLGRSPTQVRADRAHFRPSPGAPA